MNKIIVIGNLGRDPEMRYTPNGQGVTSFSVASSRKYTTSSGEQREETEWFNCSAFGKLADTCNQYLTKGTPGVCGRQAKQPHLPDPGWGDQVHI